MNEVFICDGIRTPFGKHGGSLSSVRTDDLGALPIKYLVNKNHTIDWNDLDDVILGCVNQAGEDNRNIARMSLLLAGLPTQVSGVTVNRLCGSSLEAISQGTRSIKAGEANMIIAGGVESMSRSPLVMSKSTKAFDRNVQLYDTTIGWRFINKKMLEKFGVDSMPQTAENLAQKYKISREDQDQFAYESQRKYDEARSKNYFDDELMKIDIPIKKNILTFSSDEHPRLSNLDSLSKLMPIVHDTGTVTAGNSSGINDGAAAILLASEYAINKYSLKPLARIIGSTTAGVEPKFMGIGPVPAINKLLAHYKFKIQDIDFFEINEAFSAQVLSVVKLLGLGNSMEKINPNGGAIAIGHPLGASGARIFLTAVNNLIKSKKKYALCSMCIGVGQGIATLIEKI
ncbi:MAG: 3-oxoadipyl-CoA thiolase [Hydrogenophilales bacterium]